MLSLPTERIQGALWGLLIGDALAMPVHWYYDPRLITKDFGKITDYEAPKDFHPMSIMSLSNTGGAGRGDQKGDIIGRVINHGKHKFWGKKGVHYHQGMKPGENTLNALCSRIVLRSMTEASRYDRAVFLKNYASFMTTPGSHGDTYAETFHRMFFAKYDKGKPLEKCADNDGHNTASMGGLVMVPPAVLGALFETRKTAEVIEEGKRLAREQVLLTHASDHLASVAEEFAEVFLKVMMGKDLKETIASKFPSWTAKFKDFIDEKIPDTTVIGGFYSSACYIDDSFPSLMYLAYKYSDDPEAGLIANTNIGGENVHRGAVLGALLGAQHGYKAWPTRWRDKLVAKTEYSEEVESFLKALESSA